MGFDDIRRVAKHKRRNTKRFPFVHPPNPASLPLVNDCMWISMLLCQQRSLFHCCQDETESGKGKIVYVSCSWCVFDFAFSTTTSESLNFGAKKGRKINKIVWNSFFLLPFQRFKYEFCLVKEFSRFEDWTEGFRDEKSKASLCGEVSRYPDRFNQITFDILAFFIPILQSSNSQTLGMIRLPSERTTFNFTRFNPKSMQIWSWKWKLYLSYFFHWVKLKTCDLSVCWTSSQVSMFPTLSLLRA